MAAVKHAKASGANLYPHKFNVSISLPDFVAKYKDLPDGSHDEDTVVTIAGRVYNKRASGAKLVFYDVQSDGVRIQVMADARCRIASQCDEHCSDYPLVQSFTSKAPDTQSEGCCQLFTNNVCFFIACASPILHFGLIFVSLLLCATLMPLYRCVKWCMRKASIAECAASA